MDSIKKGNLLVIFIIALLAFGTSTVVASVTDENILFNLLNITKDNGTDKLIAVSDGNFTALTANQVIIQVKNVTNTTNITNITNITNNTNNTNNTNVTNDTDISEDLRNGSRIIKTVENYLDN